MTKPDHHKLNVHTEKFSVLAPIPPFIEIILKHTEITPVEFTKIADLAAGYKNDPRMVEMVRKAGDASGKVPYLMDAGETPESILAALQEVVQPHTLRLHSLSEPVKATIHTLLSLNTIPKGCEACIIPALLEIDRMQGAMIVTLQQKMAGRKLAKEFHDDNKIALQMLDADWPHVRKLKIPLWPTSQPLPEQTKMQYDPVFRNNRLVYLFETCVIVDSPRTRELQSLIPSILRRPLPLNESAPITGSAEWLIREVGKIGRHFTRAFLNIIQSRLDAEQIVLDARNYDLINQQAQDSLMDFVKKSP